MYHSQQPFAVIVSRDQLTGAGSSYPYGPIVAYMGKPPGYHKQSAKYQQKQAVQPIAAIDLGSGQSFAISSGPAQGAFPQQGHLNSYYY